MRQRGIKNVIVMGVHTNMCVLGRPFSIRQMVYQGQNVVLVRDMTDTMYNPAKVAVRESFPRHGSGRRAHREVLVPDDHFGATCSATASRSVHATDRRTHAVFIIGEDEYKTERSLPEFAETELPDYRCTFVLADDQDKNNFPGLRSADDGRRRCW